jgi:NAD(P)-dependent dehydrogenase (short-subunit alcohol dehydrogenase family)
MELEIKGRTALVLGGGGGLGGAIADALAAEGAKIAVADIDSAAVERSVNKIESRGGEALGLVWDLSDLTVIDKNISAIEGRFAPVDVLVNITGGPPPTPAAGQDPSLWSKHFSAMVLSVIAITDRVLPNMKARGNYYQHFFGRDRANPKSRPFQLVAPCARRLVQDIVPRSCTERDHGEHHSARPHRNRSYPFSRRSQSQTGGPHR